MTEDKHVVTFDQSPNGWTATCSCGWRQSESYQDHTSAAVLLIILRGKARDHQRKQEAFYT